ncbi:MAG: PhoU domain-containing protein, partial [Rhodospirillales bacterium]
QALPALLDGDGETLAAVRALDGDVDDLHEAVILYLRSLGLKSLSSGEAADMVRLMRTADYVEQIGDLVETDMVELGYVRLSKQVTVSEETRSTLITLHALTDEAIRLALLALVRGEKELAEQVMTLKAEVDEKARIATDRVASRLTADSPGRLASYRLETQLIERLKRIFYFAKRIAKEVADRSESAGPDSGVREPKAVDPAAGTDA